MIYFIILEFILTQMRIYSDTLTNEAKIKVMFLFDEVKVTTVNVKVIIK